MSSTGKRIKKLYQDKEVNQNDIEQKILMKVTKEINKQQKKAENDIYNLSQKNLNKLENTAFKLINTIVNQTSKQNSNILRNIFGNNSNNNQNSFLFKSKKQFFARISKNILGLRRNL